MRECQSLSEDPLVSIVTPSYNQSEFVGETLGSVERQTYEHVEHFVKDGGSDDGTKELLESHRCEWVSEPDEGQAEAINEGFDRISGEIVGWLNSDDVYFDVGVIERVVRQFQKRDVDVLYGDYAIISEGSEVLTVRCLPDFDYGRLTHGCFIAQPSVFFRREIIDENQLNEDLDYGMDYEFWLRLASQDYVFEHVRDVLSGDRNYAARKIRRDPGAVRAESRRIQNEYGRTTGLEDRFARATDMIFSGVPRRLCGIVRSLRLKRNSPELAFDAAFPSDRTLLRNAYRNNSDLF